MDELRTNASDTVERADRGFVEASGEGEVVNIMNMEELLKQMLELGASDIFIVAGLPMTYEADGKQYRQSGKPMMPADTEGIVRGIYSLARRDIGPFLESHNHDDDFSFAVPGVGRFRVNVFRQRGLARGNHPRDPVHASHARGIQHPARGHAMLRLPEGLGAGHRPGRRRQVYYPGVHHRQAQP